MTALVWTPATDLPWRLFRDRTTIEISLPAPAELGGRPSVVGWSGFDSSDMPFKDQLRNAEYIIHAANAYPKMVEALREIAKPALGGKLQQFAAQALLRELGEKP